MKILFICRANVGRSQMAEAFLNELSSKHTAHSAGLNPPKQWEGEKLSKTKYVAPVMSEIGLNLDEKVSKRLTENMVANSDIVIVIGEKENWPDYLKTFPNVTYWDVVDPDTGEMELHRTVRDQIKNLIKKLITEIN
jgi:protein-tyrosine-phosphatase